MSVEVGQVYRDKDKRMRNRHLKVTYVGTRYADCVDCDSTGRELNSRQRTVSNLGLETRFELIANKEPSGKS